MGQYWKVCNFSKRQQLQLDSWKLTEWCYSDTRTSRAFMHLLASGEWRGDDIRIVGDYGDSHCSCHKRKRGEEYYCKTCQNDWQISKHWHQPELPKTLPNVSYSLAINWERREFIDLRRCPSGEWGVINPLILLLAEKNSNGRGGGDYDYYAASISSMRMVSRWAGSRDIKVVVTNSEIDDNLVKALLFSGNKEIKPNFREVSTPRKKYRQIA